MAKSFSNVPEIDRQLEAPYVFWRTVVNQLQQKRFDPSYNELLHQFAYYHLKWSGRHHNFLSQEFELYKYKWWYLCMWWRRSHLRASFCLDSLLNKTRFADHLNIEELRLACNPSQFQMDLLKTKSALFILVRTNREIS